MKDWSVCLVAVNSQLVNSNRWCINAGVCTVYTGGEEKSYDWHFLHSKRRKKVSRTCVVYPQHPVYNSIVSAPLFSLLLSLRVKALTNSNIFWIPFGFGWVMNGRKSDFSSLFRTSEKSQDLKEKTRLSFPFCLWKSRRLKSERP